MAVILGSGKHRYRVVEDWAKLPDGCRNRGAATVRCPDAQCTPKRYDW